MEPEPQSQTTEIWTVEKNRKRKKTQTDGWKECERKKEYKWLVEFDVSLLDWVIRLRKIELHNE